MSRQEKEAYLLEIVTMAHQMAADWDEQSATMKRQFDEEWARFKLMVPTMVINESRETVDNASDMLGRSQHTRYKKAADDFVAAYNALTLEYKRLSAELENPLEMHLPHAKAVC